MGPSEREDDPSTWTFFLLSSKVTSRRCRVGERDPPCVGDAYVQTAIQHDDPIRNVPESCTQDPASCIGNARARWQCSTGVLLVNSSNLAIQPMKSPRDPLRNATKVHWTSARGYVFQHFCIIHYVSLTPTQAHWFVSKGQMPMKWMGLSICQSCTLTLPFSSPLTKKYFDSSH